ncbi:YozD family protein [Bacillus sp. FJAT-47783]|uniref:YozD family protein n=1 Tax=Bacillus sp. FJAT-47783 TaxID=2922712 RepID=UPI001FADA709|nr:YozD family protein [Bacillus sp. FJAT-47783]
MREIEFVIDTEELAEYFFQELLNRGFLPSEDEAYELADITFDFLIEKCVIEEEIDIDEG